jgi:diaminopimelate decarboxylase
MLYQYRDKQLCTRMTVEQENTLNRDFKLWQHSARKEMQRATLFTFLIVFGLSFVSCSEETDKQQFESARQQAIELLTTKENTNKIAEITDPTSDEVEIVKGKLVEQEDTISLLEEIQFKEEIKVDEVICFGEIPEREYILGGAVMHRVEYVNYLEEIVPEKDKQYYEQDR